METSHLKEAGLTDGEIKVYLSLVKLGSVTTGPIIENAKISRSIIYQILDKLIEKGLVSYIIKNKTKYFQAAQPHRILEYVEEREKSLKENKEQIKKMIPDLVMMQNSFRQSEVNLYLGLNGIRSAYEHLYLKLEKGGEFCFLGIPPTEPIQQDIYWEKDHKKRIKAGIKCKLLFNQGTPKEVIKDRNKYKDCFAKIMPTKTQTPAMFMTYKDTTVIILQEPSPIAIEIVNKEITNSFQAYFNEFWKQAKP